MSDRVLSAALRQDFFLFTMRVYADLHPGAAPLHPAWYLEAMCHNLIEATRTSGARQLITVPPRHLKSVAASVALPAFLLGHNPTLKVLVATYSQELARLHASQCRAVMLGSWYRRLFPTVNIADDGNRMLEIVTTKRGGRKGISVGGTITGFGGDVIIVDDCLKAEDARSDAKRQEVKAWFDGTLATRLNTAGGGAVISISQRLHEDDLTAHLLGKGYVELCLSAIAERDERVAIGGGRHHHRRVGTLLDRPGQTRETLEAERRNLGPQVFSAQFQQNPVAPEGNLIRLEWFGTYDGTIDPSSCYRIVQSWDTGLSDLSTADYSVCTTWGYKDEHWHLLDVLRAQLAYPDLKRAVLAQHRRWRPAKVLIEDAGTGKALWQELRVEKQFRPLMCSVTENKETRLIGVTGQLEAGLCVLPAGAPWLEAFTHELRAFPFGRHDDQVDSMTQFLQYHIQRGRALLAERTPSGRLVDVPRPPDRPGRYL